MDVKIIVKIHMRVKMTLTPDIISLPLLFSLLHYKQSCDSLNVIVSYKVILMIKIC